MNELQRFTSYGEKKAGTCNKFYEVEAEALENGQGRWTFRWGRIGTSGQSKTGLSYSFSGAKDVCVGQFDRKLGSGYRETTAMEALASAVEEMTERRTNGLPAIELVIPNFHAGRSEKRCQQFCKKWLAKLNIVRASFYDLNYSAYEKQIVSVLRGYCKEYARMVKTKAHSSLADNASADTAFRIFFGALRRDAGIHIYDYFEGVG